MGKFWRRRRCGLEYYFEDEQGNQSERYFWATNYNNGFAIVQKKDFEPYYFRDVYGNLSEEFYDVYNYCNGFAIVRKGPTEAYHFRDTQGKLSEGFYSIENYHNGLAKVQKSYGQFQYRDIYGNLYDSIEEAQDALNKMQVAQNQNENPKQPTSTQIKNTEYANIEDYFNNKVTVYDISPKDIYDNLDKIVAWEKYNCELEMENNDNKAIREEIFETYSAVAEYIKHTAYEYSDKLKVEEYVERLF